MKRLSSLKHWLDDMSVIPGLCLSKKHPRFKIDQIDDKTYAYVRCDSSSLARELEVKLLASGFDVNRGFWVGGTTIEVEVKNG
jgi:hypothetical protein